MTQLDTRTKIASTEPEVNGCIEAITEAFASDPPSRWLWPDDRAYAAYFPEFVRAFGGPAFSNGGAYYVEDFAGAALWLPPGIHTDDQALEAVLQRSVPGGLLASAASVFEQMAAYHPPEPHWYLPLIGVRPDRQRRGYGAALMSPVLARCDREGSSAYLEATTADNARLYERLGFQALGRVPAGPATIVPMVRPPR